MIARPPRAASNGPGSSTSPPASSVWIANRSGRAVVQRGEHQVPVGRPEAPELDLLGGQRAGRRPRPAHRTTRPCAAPSSRTCSASGRASGTSARSASASPSSCAGSSPRSRAGSASSASAARSAAGSPGSRTTGTTPVRSAPSTDGEQGRRRGRRDQQPVPGAQPAGGQRRPPRGAGRARSRRCGRPGRGHARRTGPSGRRPSTRPSARSLSSVARVDWAAAGHTSRGYLRVDGRHQLVDRRRAPARARRAAAAPGRRGGRGRSPGRRPGPR